MAGPNEETSTDCTLTAADFKSESDFLTRLGLDCKEADILSVKPFAQPLSNRSFVVPTAWHAKESPTHISPEALSRDLPVLRLALEKAYAGWEIATEAGWNWEEFFHQWFKRLSREQSAQIPIESAFLPWSQFLSFRLDNHSGPRYKGLLPNSARTVQVLAPLAEPITAWRNHSGQTGRLNQFETAHQPWKAYFWNDSANSLTAGYALSHPASQGAWSAVYSAGRWHPVCELTRFEAQLQQSVTTLLCKERDHLAFRRLCQDIGYLRIPTLSYMLARQAEERQGQIFDDMTTVSNLVIDLRGNAGGAAKFLLGMLRHLMPAGTELATVSLRSKHSCLTDALQWGFAQNQLIAMPTSIATDVRSMLQSLIDRLQTSQDSACPVSWQHHRSRQNYAQHRFPPINCSNSPRLIILVDGNCGSDGEFLAYTLALLPNSVVVGACTAGIGEFARPGYFVLPHTRVGFRLASALTDIYGDGRAFDGYGLRIDVVASQQQPLEPHLLIQLVRKLEKYFHS